mmetsp:Transcript_22774/g.56441  ORF Transcript_22774/g.56441 Transcript_22774/m.56441 type:complete len:114 (+) Transcript_22774:898-1239(+)
MRDLLGRIFPMRTRSMRRRQYYDDKKEAGAPNSAVQTHISRTLHRSMAGTFGELSNVQRIGPGWQQVSVRNQHQQRKQRKHLHFVMLPEKKIPYIGNKRILSLKTTCFREQLE